MNVVADVFGVCELTNKDNIEGTMERLLKRSGALVFRPAGALIRFLLLPTACAVGFILAPLRG